ncbi:hypothetical protein LV779_11830 [Streptomyces thinghirensis]|nr:hypothetical protein [Streptomyces thinghirensis]
MGGSAAPEQWWASRSPCSALWRGPPCETPYDDRRTLCRPAAHRRHDGRRGRLRPHEERPSRGGRRAHRHRRAVPVGRGRHHLLLRRASGGRGQRRSAQGHRDVRVQPLPERRGRPGEGRSRLPADRW